MMQSGQQQATDLRGKVAIVTGASSGMGEAIAEELVQRGARVALFARRENRLQALAQRLAGQGSGETLIVPGDVSKPEDVQNLVKQTCNAGESSISSLPMLALATAHPLSRVMSNAGSSCSTPTCTACC